MLPFYVVKTKIRKVGDRNVNSSCLAYLSVENLLQKDSQIYRWPTCGVFMEGKEWKDFSVGAVLRFCFSLFSWLRQMARSMCEPQQDFTWQAHFCRRRKSASCQTSFFIFQEAKLKQILVKFLLVLLRNHRHTSLYKFKTYGMMIQVRYIVKSWPQQVRLTSIFSQRYNKNKRIKERNFPV